MPFATEENTALFYPFYDRIVNRFSFFKKKSCRKYGKTLAKNKKFVYNERTVLGGESAVPCICNPLQQSRISLSGAPMEGPHAVRGVDSKVLCNALP